MPKYLDEIPDIPSIVPLCLYHKISETSGQHLSYIGNPMMVKTSDNKITFKCIPHGLTSPYKGWTLQQRFYVINPMFRPIPSYMSLMCAMQRDGFPYDTINVMQMYDPFDIQNGCVNFITWIEPTPYTTPLYLYRTDEGIFATFEERTDMTREKISPIFVLTDKPNKNSIILDKNKWFEKKGDIPDFTFREYMGRCSPYPDASQLEDCVVDNAVGMIKPMSLIDYLTDIQKKNDQDKVTVSRIFEKSNKLAVAIFLIIFLVSLFAVLWMVFPKNENRGRYGK